MYGSSLRIETDRPRARRIRPMLAAVMPLPSEEVTPPVTKTYFAMDGSSGGFSNATGRRLPGQTRPPESEPGSGLVRRLDRARRVLDSRPPDLRPAEEAVAGRAGKRAGGVGPPGVEVLVQPGMDLGKLRP